MDLRGFENLSLLQIWSVVSSFVDRNVFGCWQGQRKLRFGEPTLKMRTRSLQILIFSCRMQIWWRIRATYLYI